MNALGKRLCLTLCGCLLGVITSVAAGQTFELNPNGQPAAQQTNNKKQKQKSAEGGMGWGSSIEVARQYRAAEAALEKGDYTTAMNYAERAAKAAPQNTDFWFMYGYAARLAGQYQTSIDAFKRGLENQPNSINGLSGLAQTYARMGRTDDAKRMVMRVIAANPKSANDLELAGELFLTTNDPRHAIEYLQRADNVKPAARTELLMARAYMQINQPEQSRQWMERARNRAPHDPDVLRSLAGYFRDTKQWDQAIKALQDAGSRPDVLAELGYTYQLAGKKKEAAESYARAANARPQDINYQLSAAQAFVSAEDSRGATQYADRAASLDPNHYRLHAVRAEIANLNNNTDEAIKEYQTALSNLPQGVPEGVLYPIQLRLNLYDLYRQTGNDAAAQDQVKQAQAAMQGMDFQDQNRPEFLRLRAAVEGAGGQYDLAQKDLKEAMGLDPNNVNITLNYANLLWKMNQMQDSVKMFERALQLDPANESALSSLGYLSRDLGDHAAAEKYFTRMATLYPNNYIPYLAMGDMYAAMKEFGKAQASYEKAHKLAPDNALVIAGGINSGIEGHQLPLAKNWIDRATPVQLQNPQVMREHERYLTFTGKYAESADLGYKVLEKLPRDREAADYLAYDLLYLGRYDEARAVVAKYEPVLKDDRDMPLVAGYVHVHDGMLPEAVGDFTRALKIDPTMATGYMNRGYVYNDMLQGVKAEADFQKAIEINPNYGEAHLGLSYAYLQTRHAKGAIREANIAEKLLGESATTHLARAEAYRQQVLLNDAVKEYEAALRYQPSDLRTYLALGDAQYRLHRYNDALQTANAALKLAPDEPLIHAQMAHSYAMLHQRDNAMKAINAAERTGGDSDTVLLSTGDALLIMGDRRAAMDRFSRALDVVGGDQVATRLAIARVFVREGRWEDARQQVATGFAEARVDRTQDITPDDLLQAGDIFMQTHDFDLARKYFERAQSDGADPDVVAVDMANSYLAQGQTSSAEAQLASLGNAPENDQNYDYILAKANVYRQKQDNVHALALFAHATEMNSTDEGTQQAELELADAEGRQLTDNVSMGSNISLSPIFEDINIYQLDARIFGQLSSTGVALPGHTLPASLFPPPRSSYESLGMAHFKGHITGFPAITGFVEERNARGSISIPSTLFIQYRDTYDTIFNGAINPVVHLGSSTITFTPGLEFTVRRDKSAPVDMNQNLFRQFLYVNTSSLGNWISVFGQFIREAGPFTQQNLNSRDLSALTEFTVGRPWGRTSLLTGYGVRDILFRPLVAEYYSTSAYAGLQHKFGSGLTVAGLAEYLRSWRVQDAIWANAQALRPGARFSYQPNSHWSVQGSFLWSRGQGFHAYDNVQNEFTVSYVKGIRGTLNDGVENTPVSYPLRISAGLAQQTFFNFPGSRGTSTVLPIVRLTLF